MKKKKSNTVILLFSVIAIWGYLGLQVFNFTKSETVAGFDETNQNFKPKAIREQDTFSLSLNYRDPFSNFNQKSFSAKKTKEPSRQIKTTSPPDLQIKYMGLIRENNQSKLFFLSINNQKIMLRKGQKFESLKVIDGDETKIIIDYQGRRITYNIN